MTQAKTGEAEPFTPEQETRLGEIVAGVLAGSGGKAPTQTGKGGKTPPTDDEWDNMSPRARESWVRDLVGERLGELKRDDEFNALRKEVDDLKAGGGAPPASAPPAERAPSVLSALGAWLWGKPSDEEEA
jgi:hypothetical protein